MSPHITLLGRFLSIRYPLSHFLLTISSTVNWLCSLLYLPHRSSQGPSWTPCCQIQWRFFSLILLNISASLDTVSNHFLCKTFSSPFFFFFFLPKSIFVLHYIYGNCMEIQISRSFQFKNLRLSPSITNICDGTVAKPCPALATPCTLVCQTPLSIGIPR